MSDFVREFQYAWRRLRRAPAFTVTSLVVLALGLGAATSMFSMVYAILLRPLPFAQPGRLVAVSHSIVVPGLDHVEQSDASFMLYARHNRVFDGMGAWRLTSVTLAPAGGAPGEPERLTGSAITADLMKTLGVAPARGRGFTPEDDRPGAPGVLILSNELWARKFNADPNVIGRIVIADGVPKQIVGVMPAGFRYPAASVEVWFPVQFDAAKSNPGSFNFNVVARLKPGVTEKAATADLATHLPRLIDEFPSQIPRELFEQVHLRPVIAPLRDTIVGDVSRLLWILFGAVGLVLVIACANVANLFLVRAEGRHRELAVRNALGAGRGGLVMQYLSESMLLAAAGGVVGILIAAGAIRSLAALPAGISVPRLSEVQLDPMVIAFATLVTMLSAMAVSVVPLLRTRRIAIATVLKESGRSATNSGKQQRTRSALVVAQVALALILVASSGLLARSFARLRDVAPGFDATNVATLRVALPTARYRSTASTAAFYDDVLTRTRALPGVRDVAITTWLPLTDDRDTGALGIEEFHSAGNAVPPVHEMSYISPSYFSTMRIPILSGRTIAPPDASRRLYEVVISKSFAERYWKKESPLGKRLRPGISGPWFTIVGVAGDVHLESLGKPANQAAYFPLVFPDADTTLVTRNAAIVVATANNSPAITSSVRQIVHALDASLPTHDERPMEAILAESSARAKFLVLMLGMASGIALVLGAVGIYGVMAYGVSLRQREIGVRMALGARPSDVSRMVSGQGMVLALVGVAIGLGGAFGVTRFLRGLLYDVSPTDPVTLVGTCAVLLGVALLASWLPARRAAGVDPAVVLRSD